MILRLVSTNNHISNDGVSRERLLQSSSKSTLVLRRYEPRLTNFELGAASSFDLNHICASDCRVHPWCSIPSSREEPELKDRTEQSIEVQHLISMGSLQ